MRQFWISLCHETQYLVWPPFEAIISLKSATHRSDQHPDFLLRNSLPFFPQSILQGPQCVWYRYPGSNTAIQNVACQSMVSVLASWPRIGGTRSSVRSHGDCAYPGCLWLCTELPVTEVDQADIAILIVSGDTWSPGS